MKVLLTLLLFSLASLIVAQEATTPPKEQAEEAITEEVGAYVPPTGMEPIELGRRVPLVLSGGVFDRQVTLDFKDAELQNVLRAIARQHNLNLLMHPKIVKGTITVHLENVKLGIALDSILKTNELAAVLEPGEIIRVVPRSQVQVTKIEVKTIHVPVNWVKAEELLSTLKPFLTEKAGQIKAHRDTNSLIITDTPPTLDVIKDLIARLDKPEKQVLIEARLVDMTLSAMRELGIEWSLTKNETRNGGSLSPAGTNLVHIRPSGADLVDIWKPGGKGLDIAVQKMAQFLGQDWDLDLWLDALETENKAVVLAQPRVVTLNNVPATIDIVEKIPYFEAVEAETGLIRHKVEFEEAGIKLVVTPNITSNDFVRMALKPEQKIVTGEIYSEKVDSWVPVIDTRRAETNVIVEDEQTVCLGGLRQLTKMNEKQGIPWLLRVPVFGWLFKNKKYSDKRTELVFFVTPHIVKVAKMTPKQYEQYELLNEAWKKRDLYFDDVEVPMPKAEFEEEVQIEK